MNFNKQHSYTYLISIAILCALGVVLGEYVLINNIGLFGSGNSWLFSIGLILSLLSCALYIHSMGDFTWRYAFILAFSIYLCTILVNYVVIQPLEHALINIINSINILEGLRYSGSFSFGIFHLLLGITLTVVTRKYSKKIYFHSLIVCIMGLLFLILMELFIALPIRSIPYTDQSRWDIQFLLFYTPILWVMTNVFIK